MASGSLLLNLNKVASSDKIMSMSVKEKLVLNILQNRNMNNIILATDHFLGFQTEISPSVSIIKGNKSSPVPIITMQLDYTRNPHKFEST